MRILYLSCHSILEFDEVSMFNGLGHYVFSPGAYVEPANPGDASLRPGLYDMQYDPEDVAAFNALECEPGVDRKERLTREFVERFDVVIVMHMPKWIIHQWGVLKCRPVIWRTIGQSLSGTEASLKAMRDDGMKIVRYSPKESTIPGYIGEDTMIRFWKDPDEFQGWTGKDKHVITFNQHLPERRDACNYDTWQQVVRGLPHKLYGPGNAAVGEADQGKVTFDDLKAAMRDHGCYFYVGTHPASYTLNFIEAWMTGIPMVAIGKQLGNASYFPGHSLYEVEELVTQCGGGLASDDVDALRRAVAWLLDSPSHAKEYSDRGREAAIRHFGKANIWPQWQAFLETV